MFVNNFKNKYRFEFKKKKIAFQSIFLKNDFVINVYIFLNHPLFYNYKNVFKNNRANFVGERERLNLGTKTAYEEISS